MGNKSRQNERLLERETGQTHTDLHNETLKAVYEKEFIPAYESGDFEEVLEIVANNRGLVKLMSKEQKENYVNHLKTLSG